MHHLLVRRLLKEDIRDSNITNNTNSTNSINNHNISSTVDIQGNSIRETSACSSNLLRNCKMTMKSAGITRTTHLVGCRTFTLSDMFKSHEYTAGPPPRPPTQIQNYGPQMQNNQQPYFQYSQCNGKKKALCVYIVDISRIFPPDSHLQHVDWNKLFRPNWGASGMHQRREEHREFPYM